MKQLIPTWKIVFSLKSFVTAMLALYIALSMDLERPYWAMTTVYVVSQPFAGAIRSKGVFRMIGTLMGASAGLACLGMFGTDEIWLMIGLTCWFFFCGFFALNDRSPRGYLFLLGGLTALLVAWPTGAAVSSEIAFQTAFARIEEIFIGICCTVFIDSIFFPRRIAPVIDTSVEKWFTDAVTWGRDVLSGKAGRSRADQAQLAFDADQIAMMTVHLDYEMQDNPKRAEWLRALQRRMLLLLPIMASIEDRLTELRRDDQTLPAPLQAILADVSDWVGRRMPSEEAEALRARIATFEPLKADCSGWRRVLMASLIERLEQLIELACDCRGLWQMTRTPMAPAPDRIRALARQGVSAPHRDRGMILWALGTSLCSMLVANAFWYFTGWSGGGAAALFALLMSLFFGAIDNPRPILVMLTKVLAFATILDGLYLFVIMPSVHSFPTLAMVFFPTLFVVGLLAANPATYMIALMTIALMSYTNTPSTDVTSFINSMAATIFGVLIVMAVSGVVKSVSVESSARRILRAGWRDVERIAAAETPLEAAAFTSRMLDRLGLLAPRIAALSGEGDLATADTLADLRLGLNLIELRRAKPQLSARVVSEIVPILSGVAAHYHSIGHGRLSPPPEALRHQIDLALHTTVAQEPPGQHRYRVIHCLVGIRRAIFPGAPPLADPDRAPGPGATPELRNPDIAAE